MLITNVCVENIKVSEVKRLIDLSQIYYLYKFSDFYTLVDSQLR